MNGASAELCVAINSTPNTSSITKSGSSQSFFRTFRNCQNSLRNDMSAFQEPVYTEEAVFRTLACVLILFGVNFYVARDLYHVEWLRHMGSAEGAFIEIARFAMKHWP